MVEKKTESKEKEPPGRYIRFISGNPEQRRLAAPPEIEKCGAGDEAVEGVGHQGDGRGKVCGRRSRPRQGQRRCWRWDAAWPDRLRVARATVAAA